MDDTWVKMTGENSTEYNMQREKETFMEVNKSFMDPGASTLKKQM